MKFLFTTLAVCLAVLTLPAQTASRSIRLLAKSKADGIWLRWAPVDPETWKIGNQQGYVLERFTLAPDGTILNPLGDKLTSSPLKIFSPRALDTLSRSVPEAKLLKELAYGEDQHANFSGNDPLSAMAYRRESENRFGVGLLICDLSIRTAEAAGLFFADRTARRGTKYIYRISIPDPKAHVEPGVQVVEFTNEKKLQPPVDLHAEFTDHHVALSWASWIDRGIYTAYHIEKSEDGKNYQRITKVPYVPMSTRAEEKSAKFVDSLVENNHTYYYRVMGITPFGEHGPATAPVKGEGQNNLAGLLIAREGKLLPDGNIKIDWEFPMEEEKQISGFRVWATGTPTSGFHEVTNATIPSPQRSYSFKPLANNTYFYLTAVDATNHERAKSFPFLVQREDNTPPAVPVVSSGNVSDKGLVTLRWKANREEDLQGYRVFRGNDPATEFMEVTHSIVSDTSYTDTVPMNVLNKKIYYRLTAVDRNYNNSAYSRILSVTRPDHIAPAPAIIQQTSVQPTLLRLSWDTSVSEDVAELELRRCLLPDTTGQVIASLKSTESTYEDRGVVQGNKYRYILITIDSAGNQSRDHSGDIFFETGVRPAVNHLLASVDREKKVITLEWKSSGEPEKVIVYRRKNKEPLTQYKTLAGSAITFADDGRNVSTNNTYYYRVQPVYPGGIRATLSVEVKVVY